LAIRTSPGTVLRARSGPRARSSLDGCSPVKTGWPSHSCGSPVASHAVITITVLLIILAHVLRPIRWPAC